MDYRQCFTQYIPQNEQEETDQRIIAQWIERDGASILLRENERAHVTASGWVCNEKMDKLLMVYHNIFQSWTIPGGHADGESDPLQTAIRESKEETGLTELKVPKDEMITLDIVPALAHTRHGHYVAPHVHLNAAYILIGDEHAQTHILAEENSDVQWIPLDDVLSHINEPHMVPLYAKVVARLQKQTKG